VTHGHFDHVGNTVEVAASTGAEVHAIHEVALWLESVGVGNVVGSNKGGTIECAGRIKASLTTAIHSSGISGDEGVIPGGEAGGWVLEFPDGPTVYHAGDTMVFGDMSLIREIWEPDIAFLPIGGWYTMGPRQAAMAGRLLEAETVVPIHYGTFPILTGTPEELRQAAERRLRSRRPRDRDPSSLKPGLRPALPKRRAVPAKKHGDRTPRCSAYTTNYCPSETTRGLFDAHAPHLCRAG
jgi:L-ascorbate metabolism protein UlaG (beta-lactamase superfamily)